MSSVRRPRNLACASLLLTLVTSLRLEAATALAATDASLPRVEAKTIVVPQERSTLVC